MRAEAPVPSAGLAGVLLALSAPALFLMLSGCVAEPERASAPALE